MTARARLLWLLTALLAAVGYVAVALAVLRTGPGSWFDDLQRGLVLNGVPAGLRQLLDTLARPWLLVVLGPLDAVLVLLALVRRAWRRAVAAPIIIATSAALTLGLHSGQLLGFPDDGYPSDHATIGIALVVGLAVLWPVPLRRRGLTVLAALVLVIAVGNVSWYAHRPGDVAGSVLVVLAVTGVVFALFGGDVANLRPRSRAD